MNKITKLHLIIPALLLLPISVTAAAKKPGWLMTPDGKNRIFDSEKAKLLIQDNSKGIDELIEDIRTRKLKGEKGESGKDGENGRSGDMGIEGEQGRPGEKGKQGRPGSNGVNGEVGAKGLTGDSFYTDNYGNMNLLSVIAVSGAVSSMPTPTSNGFFTSVGFSNLGGEQASAIGIHYVDDVLSYKATYGHGGHEQSIGFGIGIRL